MGILGYRLSHYRQKQTFRTMLKSRLVPLSGSGQSGLETAKGGAADHVTSLAAGSDIMLPGVVEVETSSTGSSIMFSDDEDGSGIGAPRIALSSVRRGCCSRPNADTNGKQQEKGLFAALFAAIASPCRRVHPPSRTAPLPSTGASAWFGNTGTVACRYLCFLPRAQTCIPPLPLTGPSRRTHLMLARRMVDDAELIAAPLSSSGNSMLASPRSSYPQQPASIAGLQLSVLDFSARCSKM